MEWHNAHWEGVGVNHLKGDTVGFVVCSVRALGDTVVCSSRSLYVHIVPQSAAPPTTLQRSLIPGPLQEPGVQAGLVPLRRM